MSGVFATVANAEWPICICTSGKSKDEHIKTGLQLQDIPVLVAMTKG